MPGPSGVGTAHNPADCIEDEDQEAHCLTARLRDRPVESCNRPHRRRQTRDGTGTGRQSVGGLLLLVNQRKAGEWTLCDGQITFNPSPSVILEGLKPEEHEGEWLLVPTGKIGRFLCEKLGVAGASFHKHMTQNDRAGGTR